MRGRVWWMIYRDEAGRIVQENSGCVESERAEAIRALALRSLPVAIARVKALEDLTHATTKQIERAAAQGQRGSEARGQRSSGKRSLRSDASSVRARSGQTRSSRGGKK